jgi:hypothetical protein
MRFSLVHGNYIPKIGCHYFWPRLTALPKDTFPILVMHTAQGITLHYIRLEQVATNMKGCLHVFFSVLIYSTIWLSLLMKVILIKAVCLFWMVATLVTWKPLFLFLFVFGGISPSRRSPGSYAEGEITLYSYVPMFLCNNFLMGRIRKIQKPKEEADKSGKFKNTRRK